MGRLINFSRWRKKQPRNSIVIDASLIRAIIIDNLDLSIPASLQDFVQETDDFVLNLLGEAVASDPEVWTSIVDAVIDFVTSYKFADIISDGGLLNE